jgi:glutamyl-Q tRNA(Asp) synthetase
MFSPSLIMTDYPHTIARFAPSPTGPLHIGSLIAAVASYLDARNRQGQWLLRIEDLDPPREPEGAAQVIIECLQQHGLDWDGDILWQSQRHHAYQQAVEQLLAQGKAYYCSCNRQRIQSLGGRYDGHCRGTTTAPTEPAAIRLQVNNNPITINDGIQGCFSQQLEREVGDFVIRRKDSLFAYQLAVVIDDGYQQITDVLRGSDLLDSTPRQVFLQQQLGLITPRYCHIPVITNDDGQKLSKQTFAKALDNHNATDNLRLALHFLRQPAPPTQLKNCRDILLWSCQHWQREAIAAKHDIAQSTLADFAS